ncbi:putative mitochondrial ATP-dependent zinc metallopeptidase [Trypanosoma cruzi]|uniref:Mitochondrial ATP-dependent zinc metallopeptidase, putative n=2 Tax=Trypanosoma cruzi TaxID=5693 RepID=Q4DAV1_TRYCC|nr:mitochondrial ATP-dependent zinc metallopeptidase, putative [Trypanosoma cruzi]EAN89642.1 mitochondrial ATP-dependent zinc metallopeptidase, putative [Trypanosoma cruzi]PWV16151.1 putative mitochondrial ATP-dependent zinc metallopeptidase [Trypanosoma cruzi]RNC59112.1 putative mitochondrial Mitochondrial ATP-dependent zinc metallopeptidase [Trypanosoma cruzi]|eukprot:XP_811493.1 mitochondrial ATP-dependent zinc metallopeptidase [Trypanosoma cruzi strain CL Brener]
MFRVLRVTGASPFFAHALNTRVRFCATGGGKNDNNNNIDSNKSNDVGKEKEGGEESRPFNNSTSSTEGLLSGKRHPKGFEAFYSKYILGRMPFTRVPAESVKRAYTMSPEERILTMNLAAKALKWKRIRRIGIVCFLLAGVLMARMYVLRSYMVGEINNYAAIAVDLSKHTAAFLDEKGKYLGIRNFVDYRAFEATCDKNMDILILFHSYYPWVPMLLLCLLPFLAATNSTFSRSAKMASVVAEKSRFNFKREISVSTRLADVAGLTEAKHEVVEVIDFLKNPARYQALGAKLPKGVLLDGPPGVGKTLLAKAVAGEAMVPFLSCSGSEFEEVYVGVGAQRVRELFRQAHEHKPCVVFVDEIDAFGRKRKTETGGGSSRGTLNAFLSELDGFKDATGIMVLAATNRVDILDNALTRSGRFDRKITLEKPSYKDREAIAKVHLSPLKLEASSNIHEYARIVAALTPGCSGADIFNICNEAAIQAAREKKDHVTQQHFHQAVERVLVGLERSAVKLSETERERIAFHEAGVVILHWFQDKTDPVVKTTILPRGRHRTGVTQKLPQTTFIFTQEQLMQNLVAQLGGYVAEEYFFQDISTCAAEDVQSATNKARHFVCTYGMDPETIGHFGYQLDQEDSIQKPFGPVKEDVVDQAVHRLLEVALKGARTILNQYLDKTRVVAGLLMRQETLTAHELWLVLGDRPVMTREFRAYLES